MIERRYWQFACLSTNAMIAIKEWNSAAALIKIAWKISFPQMLIE